MSGKIKILGGTTTNQLLKIPLSTRFPVQFKPEFEKPVEDKNELARIVREELKLHIYHASDQETPIRTLQATLLGQDAFFEVENDWKDSAGPKVSAFDLLRVCIVRESSTKSGAIEELSEFVYQVTPEVAALAEIADGSASLSFASRGNNRRGEVRKVSLVASARQPTEEQALWDTIRNIQLNSSFNKYESFMNGVFGLDTTRDDFSETAKKLLPKRTLPFTNTDNYQAVKALTETFLLVTSAIDFDLLRPQQDMHCYIEDFEGGNGSKTLPYLNQIRNKLADLRINIHNFSDILDLFQDRVTRAAVLEDEDVFGILKTSLTRPSFIELIWSYWHEESMLVQTIHAISHRFQNQRIPGGKKDPLASMEIAPLRPLNNLLWGYIQDEQHRLSVVRRAFEYDHHYGIALQGKAVPQVQGADSRVNFLEAFHQLLHRSAKFYLQDDDLTVKADGFPILNALREVHFILSEGMHNQYGDLPFTARVEMLIQQWLLARPEFREFLPSRTMVAYPENWMGPLSTMNSLQGWTNTSPISFNTLAVYGELILLTVRFGDWSDLNKNADDAAEWARNLRPEIQGYIHAYRTVTGVELSVPSPQTGKIDAQQPSIHLMNRAKVASNGNGKPAVVKY